MKESTTEVRRRRRLGLRSVLAALTMTVGLVGVTTDTAKADPVSDCGLFDACLYFNSSSHGFGAYFRQLDGIPNYGTTRTFRAGNNGSNGATVLVKNNAAAVENLDPMFLFRVAYNSGASPCAVACQFIPAYDWRNLNATLKNNNAGGIWPK